ncbi:MAG: hypothetical protein HC796_08980 [Synechococcaceae cyanobacterium RL_1_2]|nr:hypothetical protein [Synechococcaceae cyanobacterium RL_1_2]
MFALGWSKEVVAQVQPLDLNLPPTMVEESTLLQRWPIAIPDLTEQIKHEPIFSPRIGISFSDERFGVNLRRVNIPGTRWVIEGNYDPINEGVSLDYYSRALGHRLNIAPTIGYDSIEIEDRSRSGISLGVKVLLFGAGDGGDGSVSHRFVNPGEGSKEMGITSLSLGYALTSQIRLATDFNFYRTIKYQEDQFKLNLEFLL